MEKRAVETGRNLIIIGTTKYYFLSVSPSLVHNERYLWQLFKPVFK